jgi:hypothetical protein
MHAAIDFGRLFVTPGYVLLTLQFFFAPHLEKKLLHAFSRRTFAQTTGEKFDGELGR